MHEKIVLTILVSLAIVHSEEIFPIFDVKEAGFSNLELSTIPPYLSPYNEHLTKTKSRRSIFLLTPLSEIQYEDEEPKETIQKTKRCDTQFRKNRSSFTKEDATRRRTRNYETDIHEDASRKYSGNVLTKNEDKILQQALKDNLNAKNVIVNLESQERAKCNTGKYICYCEENCSQRSKTSSSQILGSSRRVKDEKSNYQKLAEQNTKPSLCRNILQQVLPRLYYESPNKSRLLRPINSFPIQSHEEKMSNILYAPILHEISPQVKLHMMGNKKKAFNVGIPFASRPDIFVKNNIQDQLRSIYRQKLQGYACSPGKNHFETPVKSIITPTPDYDANDAERKNNVESYDKIEIGKSRDKYFPNYRTTVTTESWNDYVGASTDSIIKPNFYPDYSTDSSKKNYVTEFPSSYKTTPAIYINELKDTTEKIEAIERRTTEIPPELTATVSADHVDFTVKTEIEKEPPKFIMTPEKHYNNTRTNLETSSVVNSYYSQATTKTMDSSKLSADPFRTIASVQTGHTDKSANSETESNLDPDSLSRNIEKSQMREIIRKFELEDSAEATTPLNQDNEHSKLTTSSSAEDYVNTNAPSITDDERFMNSEECIQLFGRDVCVLSAKSLPMQTGFAIHAPEYDSYDHSTVRVPEYIVKASAKRRTTLPDTSETVNANFISQTSTDRTGALNADVNENFELTSSKSNIKLDEVSQPELYGDRSIEQTYDQDGKYNAQCSDKYKSSSIVEDAYTPVKNLMEKMTDKTESTRNKLLGKSKDRKIIVPLSQNYDTELEKATTTNPTTIKKFLYSTISYKSDDEINDFVTTNTIPNTNINFHQKEDTTSNYDLTTEYKFEEKTTNNLMMELTTHVYPLDKTLQEQSTTAQYFDNEKKDNLDKTDLDYTTESLLTVIDSSTRRLPFCDNTLLLHSIKKVINDFASNADLTRTGLNKDILQMQGKSLLPEILEIPNLKNILLMPRIEDTIVKKVKGVLSEVTNIPREDFTKNWLHNVIENTVRNLLENLHSSDNQQLPSMTVKEHQFKHGQWQTNLMNLSPVPNSNELLTNSENLRNMIVQSIKDLLGSPAIASQANRDIVRNMIVQSVKNNLNNNEENKETESKMNDSIIYDALNNVLQTLKVPFDTSKSNESKIKSVNNEINRDINISQKESQGNYKIEKNLENAVLDSVKKFDGEKNKEINNNEMRINNYQKIKALENKSNILPTESPYLSELYEEGKNTYTEVKTPILSTVNEGVTEAYHKVISQYNPSVLTTITSSDLIKSENLYQTEDTNVISEATTISSITENFHETKEDDILDSTKLEKVNVQNAEESKNDKSSEHIIYQPEKEIKKNYTLNGIEHNMTQYNKTINQKESQETSVNNIMDSIVKEKPNLPTNRSYEILDAQNNIISRIENINIQNEKKSLTFQPSETNTQETIKKSLDCISLEEPSEILSSQSESVSTTRLPNLDDKITTEYITDNKISTVAVGQNYFITKSPFPIDENFNTEIAATSASSLLLNDNEIKINTDNSHSENYFDEQHVVKKEYNATGPIEESFPKYEMDSTNMYVRNESEPSIDYYSPNDRILNYIKNHRNDDDNKNKSATVNDIIEATTNSMQKSPDYAQLLNLNKNIANVNKNGEREAEIVLNGSVFSSTTSSNTPINAEYKKAEITSSFMTDGNLLKTQQQDFLTDDIIKVHEITTEMQKTYAKTVYYKTRPLNLEEDSKSNSPTIACEVISATNSKDSDKNNSSNLNAKKNVINNNINDIDNNATKINELFVSAIRSSSDDTDDSLKLFPSSDASEGSISQLQKSQLYYISDGIKLPLEIRSLKDGTYALSISKNICEQVLKRNCPCCVPLEGHIVQSTNKKSTSDVEKDNQSIYQSLSRTTTRTRTPQNLGNKKRTHPLNKRKKRDLIENDSEITSMPVLDFAKKYNLSLDFNEEDMLLNEIGSHDIIQNYDKSLIKSNEQFKHDQSKEINLVDITENKSTPKKIHNIKIPNKEKGRKREEIKLAKLNGDRGNERRMDNNEHNSEIKVFENKDGRPYRYQRNVNGTPNQGVEIVKNMLYWLKDLFVNE